MQDEQRVLGIDYGEKRIGLALSDPLLTFAYPFETLLNNSKIFEKLSSILKEKNISKIILGYPLKIDGTPTNATEPVEKFKKELEKKFSIEIILWDERYSSSIAMDRMIEAGTKKSHRRDKGLLDRNAAAVILTEYLDSIKKA